MIQNASSDSVRNEQISCTLTERQKEIACLVAQGLTEREAADCLYLSPSTVHEHVRHIYERLDVHSRAELVAAVVRSGICEPEK